MASTATSKTNRTQHINSLKTALNAKNIEDLVLTDLDSLQTYGRDWTRFFNVDPLCVVFPETTKQVQSLVRWARSQKIGLVPSGGRTGLSGGAVATNGEVVVSFDRMNKILEFNPVDRTLTTQAGVTTEAIQIHAQEKGFFYPVDFAARGSSHIGGNIATNAGGVKVVRYGLTRDWVRGLKVVTGTGEILDLNKGLIKNATGYDLRHLFIGSEGTLGFITEACLGVTTPPKELQVVLVALADLNALMNVFAKFRALPLTAFEMFSHKALEKVQASTQLPAPFAAPSAYYALAEIETLGSHTMDDIEAVFTQCLEDGLVTDGSIAQNSQQARDFWRYRENISESLAPYTPYKNDISVCISKVTQFLSRVEDVLKQEHPHYEIIWFGHLGDGNLHVNILKPQNLSPQEFLKECQRVDEILFAQIQALGGSISAEHGVGLVKKPFLTFARSQTEIDLCKQLKHVFDPDGILNPGKIF